jgi:hypothetical protein
MSKFNLIVTMLLLVGIGAALVGERYQKLTETHALNAIGSSKSSYPYRFGRNVLADRVYQEASYGVVILSHVSSCPEINIHDVAPVIGHDDLSAAAIATLSGIEAGQSMVRPAVFEGRIDRKQAAKCSVEPGFVRFIYSEQEMADHILTDATTSLESAEKKAAEEFVKDLAFPEPVGRE